MNEVRQYKCRFGCKDRTGVKMYSTVDGKMKFALCPSHKLTFGQEMVDPSTVVVVINKATKVKNLEQKVKISKQLDRQTASTEAGRLGLCEYPSCDNHDTKLFMTKSPNPITLQLKGRYCLYHVGILNSNHRVLPYRMGRLTEYVVESVCCRRIIDPEVLAYRFEVAQEHVERTIALAIDIVKPTWPVIHGVITVEVAVQVIEAIEITPISSAEVSSFVNALKEVMH